MKIKNISRSDMTVRGHILIKVGETADLSESSFNSHEIQQFIEQKRLEVVKPKIKREASDGKKIASSTKEK